MKKFILLFLMVVLNLNCSSGGGDDSPDPDPIEENGISIAVNDNFTGIEDASVIIQNLLSNDTVLDNARLTAFDATSTNGGTIVDNRNDTYTYTPLDDFIGDDTFTYTICDKDMPADCSTATVTITVEDEGSPSAENDDIIALKNATKTITTLLENDSLIDEAVLTSVDDTATQGTVVLNTDGTISYTPPTDYTGEDSFVYSICDDDQPNSTCDSATVTLTVITAINFNIPSELADYYEGVIFSEDSDLTLSETEFLTIISHTTILTYTQRHLYLYNADADINNSDNVTLMYTGESRYWEEYTSGSNAYSSQTFNTEHIFPQSKLSADDAVTDLHHLRSCADDVNSLRSNYPFTTGSGANQLIDGNSWYPGDEWKGDVARMVLYLNIRYGETISKVGTLEMFLQWNIDDPVSAFEEQRNNVIYAAQGNRNPFIDNPYIATLIWGGDAAENRWE
ncbi:MAG: endonuclease [Algibacter sp.]